MKKDRLAEIARHLPDGGLPEDREVLGGFLGSEGDQDSVRAEEAREEECITVITGGGHKIHAARWCGSGTSWEIVSEVVLTS